MKKIITFCAALALLSFTGKQEMYQADVKATTLKWTAKEEVTKNGTLTTDDHWGTVNLLSGNLRCEGGAPVSGNFVIDMNSMTDQDLFLKGDMMRMIGHLKNADFFMTSVFPTATLNIKSFEPNTTGKTGNYIAVADLTIKGIRKEIKFPAQIDVTGGGVNATASITLNRTYWNVLYKSKTVFRSNSSDYIYDDITLNVNLVMHHQSQSSND
jgi:polyisoprenoid-binding protein YceI